MNEYESSGLFIWSFGGSFPVAEENRGGKRGFVSWKTFKADERREKLNFSHNSHPTDRSTFSAFLVAFASGTQIITLLYLRTRFGEVLKIQQRKSRNLIQFKYLRCSVVSIFHSRSWCKRDHRQLVRSCDNANFLRRVHYKPLHQAHVRLNAQEA